MIWKPRATVAVVIERNAEFLMVEEPINGEMQLNQPAGHLEPGESLIDAAIRETQEETAWRIEPKALVGIYRWQAPNSDDTYMRFCFSGELIEFDKNQALDADIHQTLWLNKQQIEAEQKRFRSPLVLQCFEDYWAGHRYPLDLIRN